MAIQLGGCRDRDSGAARGAAVKISVAVKVDSVVVASNLHRQSLLQVHQP